MASVPVYCLCKLPYDVTRFMIECDICQDWFHGSCVGVEEEKATEIDLYHCPNCQVTHGPSVMRKRRGSHKQSDSGGGGREAGRPVKTGSSQFVRELRSRTFPSADEVLLKPTGAQLTVEFLEERSFSVPVLVQRKDGLGMSLPPASFSVSDVEHYIGTDKEIDVIDVCRQADVKMRLGDFAQYYNSPNRDRVLNVISLEFSETRLSNLVETPKIVRKLSWVENLWPEESVFERPNVQKYCLMGVKDSYTDFQHRLRGHLCVVPRAAGERGVEGWEDEQSKKYGSVFTVHFGPKKVVVLAGYKTVKQALVHYAEEFGDREIGPLFRDMAKEHVIKGPMARLCRDALPQLNNPERPTSGLPGGGEEKIIEESRYLIEVFENFKGEPFDTTQPVNYAVSNIICAIMYGSRFDYADPAFQQMVDRANQTIRLAGSAEMRVKRTQILKNTRKNIEEIMGLAQGLKDTLNPQDLRGFVDSFLIRQQEESDQPGSYFHNNNLNRTVVDLFAAGTDTTGTTLRWGLLLMAKYPHIQDQVQEELSQVIGEREPRVEDRRNLPYTDAVIHEIQRLANIVPLSLPHTTSCDITFQGHFIKKGTTVIPLLTSVLQDEEEWETPHSFNPGHFLDEKGCFIRRDAFMPFSAGRRACLGESLARMELFLFFTFLLQRFHFSPPPGVSEDELDLTPSVGVTLNPSPHQLCAVSRV
ncbi:hypothetical protein SKAU_G00116310 [Synaphobranchus kaupii]|uniref:PHD-type domain-containing protein n=1 Tax=Synaphobranchus kaupii TaxID=118154 RepID=A0A9Q1FMP5_SYNKA|nr:hypothetical protein SKAU_G00116310 [Synaphobranchus kaupii]